jgi:hypothetical protein
MPLGSRSDVIIVFLSFGALYHRVFSIERAGLKANALQVRSQHVDVMP